MAFDKRNKLDGGRNELLTFIGIVRLSFAAVVVAVAVLPRLTITRYRNGTMTFFLEDSGVIVVGLTVGTVLRSTSQT